MNESASFMRFTDPETFAAVALEAEQPAAVLDLRADSQSTVLDLRADSEPLLAFDQREQFRFRDGWRGLLDTEVVFAPEWLSPSVDEPTVGATGADKITSPMSGDVDGDGVEDEPIYIDGGGETDFHYFFRDPGGDTGGGGGGGGGTGGGGTGISGTQNKEDADNTPCVNELPAGVTAADLDTINDLAKWSGREIASLQDSTGWEWGAYIYRYNGQYYQSPPFTAQKYDSMDGAAGSIPTGAVIVGYMHTHPEDDDMDERNLSEDDVRGINRLIAGGRADPNLLAYVVTKDNSTRYHTYVYDKGDRNDEDVGCDL